MATFTQIANYTITGSAASSIDIQSIPSTYTDLVVKLSLRHTTAGGEDTPYVRFNNDSGSNYDQVFGSARGSGSGTPAQSSGGTTASWIGTLPGAGDTSDSFASIDLFIPNYANTSYYKVHYAESVTEGMAASLYTRVFGSTWKSTSAINRITVAVNSGYSLAVGSSVNIYGISKS